MDGKPIIAGYPSPHWDPRPGIRTVCAKSSAKISCIYNQRFSSHELKHSKAEISKEELHRHRLSTFILNKRDLRYETNAFDFR